MEFEFLIEQAVRKISIEPKEKAFVIREGGTAWEADIRPVSENVVSILVGGRAFTAYIGRTDGKIIVHLNGAEYIISRPERGSATRSSEGETALAGKLRIKAPMPGKVIKVNVAEGDAVRRNQTLAIVEAMKMENEVKSPGEAVVTKIFVAPGGLVDSENPLVELEFQEPGEAMQAARQGGEE